MPEGYTGAEVYRRMNAFPQNAALLEEAYQAATKLQSAHTELADRLARIQGKMDGKWSGEASAKAQAGLNPLIQTSHQASEDLNRSAQSMSGQNSAFHDTKARLVPLATTRPSTDDLASYLPFGASDSEKAAAQWDTDDRTNKQAYGTYYAITDSNRNAAAKEYPVLNAAPAGIAVGTAPAPPPVTGFNGVSGTGSGRKGIGASGGHHAGGPSAPSGAPTPGPSSPESVTAPGSHDITQPGGRPSDSTTTSGYTPPKPPVSTAPGFGTGLLPTFGPVGTGGDTSHGGGIGSLGGGVPGSRGPGGLTGGAPGTGAGAGQPLGGGRGSGVGMPGETGTARPGGIGSPAGAAGAKGVPGMGGMAPGAGKGKASEDEEHQRKVTLPDQDADELFGGTPDGMKPVPPTIGA